MTEIKNILNTVEPNSSSSNSNNIEESCNNDVETKQMEEEIKEQRNAFETEFNLNETPLKETTKLGDSISTTDNLDVTPVNNYYSKKWLNTQKRKSTPLKLRSTTKRERKQEQKEEQKGKEKTTTMVTVTERKEGISRKNDETRKTNLNVDDYNEKHYQNDSGDKDDQANKENDTSFYHGTSKKRIRKEREQTSLRRKTTDIENKRNKSEIKNEELKHLKYDISPLPKNESNATLKNNCLNKNKKNNSKKTSPYEENCYFYTPGKRENTNWGNEKERIQRSRTPDITKEKLEIDGINLHDLPEHVKSEYVSYLCSPLKRSERIIKTKINKLLSTHNEKKKKKKIKRRGRGEGGEGDEEKEDGDDTYEEEEKEEEEEEEDTKDNEDILKGQTDVNKMACDFFPQDEERCWDEFYTQSVDKAKPFTGITTETSVQIITQLLKANVRKIKKEDADFYSPISENDTIMEIGHGTHPLAVEMQNQWGTVGRYIGIEFSGAASAEALKCKKLKELLMNRKVEFIKILNMNYYENDSLNGVVAESNISAKNTKTDFIKMYSFKYVFAKSTLDYITCRLDNTGNSTDWEEDLQISPTVVQMFNSLADSLQNSNKHTNADMMSARLSTNSYNIITTATSSANVTPTHPTTPTSTSINKKGSYIIFVEPSDPAKFRDHILTIFKVIYTATFKYNSSAKFLRLVKIVTHNKASGYMIEKRNQVYQNFEEMRQETTKLILKSSYAKYVKESDWFLPINEPKKWISNNPNDIEYLVNLDNSKN